MTPMATAGDALVVGGTDEVAVLTVRGELAALEAAPLLGR